MQKQLSRRAALQTGFGAALLPLVASSAAHAEEKTDLLLNLQMLSSSDPAFRGKIDQNYPGLLEDKSGGVLAPCFHIIANNGTHSVSAVTLRWTFLTSTEESEAFDRHVMPSVMGHWYTGVTPLIPKGLVRVFSPFFSWSPQQYSSLVKPLEWTKLLSHSEVTRFRSTSLLRNVQATQMTIDAVIWGNGVVSGPDHSSLAKEFVVTRNGEHDAAYDVQTQLRQGKSQSQLDQFLSSQFAGIAPEPRNRIHRRYDTARRRESGFLLNALRTQSPAEFRLTIQSIVSRPRTVLNRASS